jgi:hypothetical protein
MDLPLTNWYCDVCGEKIEDVSKGYVIWQSAGSKNHGFKIIHQGKCDIKSHPASAALKDFVGEKGLSYCLTFLSLGPVITNNGSEDHCDIQDFGEFTDFVRRVQVPYYEEARRLYSNSQLLEDLSDANEFYPYIPERMKAFIERYGR